MSQEAVHPQKARQSLIVLYAQALDACEALKEEERRRTAALEESIAGLREAQAGRDMRRAESALRPVPRPQGPLQLTGVGAYM